MKCELPPSLRGDTEAQLAQLSSYIFRLVQYLNTQSGESAGGTTADTAAIRREVDASAARTRKYCAQTIAQSDAEISALSGRVDAAENSIEALESAGELLSAALTVSGSDAAAAGDLSVAGSLSIGGVTLSGAQLAQLIAAAQT